MFKVEDKTNILSYLVLSKLYICFLVKYIFFIINIYIYFLGCYGLWWAFVASSQRGTLSVYTKEYVNIL